MPSGDPGARPLTRDDVDLFDAARVLLEQRHHPSLHQVVAAVRGESGAIYTGLHLGSRRVNVCAESSAIAAAVIAGEERIVAAVAVCMGTGADATVPQVTNPCGVCRELMGEYGADAKILVDDGGVVRAAELRELLPLPWLRAEELEVAPAAPTTEHTP